jgi:hypothetical protein
VALTGITLYFGVIWKFIDPLTLGVNQQAAALA